MIATGTFVIYSSGQDGWQVGTCGSERLQLDTVDLPQDTSIDEVAEQLATFLKQRGYVDQGVTLAIPSNWCLCAGVHTDGLPRKNAREAMIYRLEEKLPIAAEEAVTDFVPGNGHSLGVCVQTDQLAPIVEALEQHGVRVDLICPTALLALQHKMSELEDRRCNTIIWGHDQRLELFAIDDNKPVAWRLLSQTDGEDLPVQLAMQALTRVPPLCLTTSDVGPSVRNCLATMPEIQVIADDDQSMLDAAAAGAHQIASGKRGGWINLRRDALASTGTLRQVRKPLKAAVAALMLFLVGLSAVSLWRANAYRQMAIDFENQQIEAYREAFPNRPVPMNIKSRMRSEHRRLAALRGEDSTLPTQRNVLLMLKELLASLPAHQRHQIFELQVDEDKLYMEGQVLSHSHAEAIAAALNKLGRFKIDPPRTEKLSGDGIAFTIRGTTVRVAPPNKNKRDRRL